MYDGLNPFAGHEWKAKGGERHICSIVDSKTFETLLSATTSPQIHQAVILAYHTGLRPSEVYRIRAEDFNHEKLMLRVRATKTGPKTRYIAIPRKLSNWVLNNSLIAMCGHTIENRIGVLKRDKPELAGVCMETFRRNFAAMMEQAGATGNAIDAHQGRTDGSVREKHYLRDPLRAVNLMRSFMSVFDGELEAARKTADLGRTWGEAK
jgi:integrase